MCPSQAAFLTIKEHSILIHIYRTRLLNKICFRQPEQVIPGILFPLVLFSSLRGHLEACLLEFATTKGSSDENLNKCFEQDNKFLQVWCSGERHPSNTYPKFSFLHIQVVKMGTGEFNAERKPTMDWHPIQGEVETLLFES